MAFITQLVPVDDALAVEVMKFFQESWKMFYAIEGISYVRIVQYLLNLVGLGRCLETKYVHSKAPSAN